jgi:putative phosphoserine phosphatase / 1-acylglycerol-3-phosphate O-acyltransferase
LKYRSLDADTKRIMTAIRRQLPREASVPHAPTDEELRLTYPPGYKGDPDLEVERRPGTD